VVFALLVLPVITHFAILEGKLTYLIISIKKEFEIMDLLETVKEKIFKIILDDDLWSSEINVLKVRPLNPGEAIGNPERKDFPLLKGKEMMLQADFRRSMGQAYTDMPGNFKGTLREVFQLPLIDNFQRAVLVSSINAVLRYLGYIENTVHCRDREPTECAARFKDYILANYGNPKIAFIGLQPAIVESLLTDFEIRVVDLDKDNIGLNKNGMSIEDASHTEEIISWSDIIIATGTTAVNNTLTTLLDRKPIIFYGVTISGIAYLMGYKQCCFCSH
jgi:hypothetical protein